MPACIYRTCPPICRQLGSWCCCSITTGCAAPLSAPRSLQAGRVLVQPRRLHLGVIRVETHEPACSPRAAKTPAGLAASAEQGAFSTCTFQSRPARPALSHLGLSCPSCHIHPHCTGPGRLLRRAARPGLAHSLTPGVLVGQQEAGKHAQQPRHPHGGAQDVARHLGKSRRGRRACVAGGRRSFGSPTTPRRPVDCLPP